MVRFLIPFVAVLLFLLEPEFAKFSPIHFENYTAYLSAAFFNFVLNFYFHLL